MAKRIIHAIRRDEQTEEIAYFFYYNKNEVQKMISKNKVIWDIINDFHSYYTTDSFGNTAEILVNLSTSPDDSEENNLGNLPEY